MNCRPCRDAAEALIVGAPPSGVVARISLSPLIASLIQVAANAPFFVLALPAEALGDIVNKRKLLLVTQVAMMV